MDAVYKDTITVTGSTNLPAGQNLSIDISTTNMHPTPRNYDWSHEMAQGTGSVFSGNATMNRYTATVDGSKLNPGEYFVSVEPENDQYSVRETRIFNLFPKPSRTPAPANFIDWVNLSLPKLRTNDSITPVMLSNEIVLVPPAGRTGPWQIPYGSIMLYSTDGIVRVFDDGGIQISAMYDSNQLHITAVPSGALISDNGNVTRISLNNTLILTSIHEAGSDDRTGILPQQPVQDYSRNVAGMILILGLILCLLRIQS